MKNAKKFLQGVTIYQEWRDHSKDNKKYLARMAIINVMLAKKASGEKLTFADEITLIQQINVSTLSDKMEDFYAVSTSVMMNERCQNRAKCKNSICANCYAAANLNRFSGLMQACETNYLILNNFDISAEAWKTLVLPSTNSKFRIESHGDTATTTCAKNYIKIIKSHKWLFFGVWTKNIDHYRAAFNEYGKPGNMSFVFSSPFKNTVAVVPDDMKTFVDHVFTVYTKEYAEKNDITINCGEYAGTTKINHKCKNCLRCYTPGTCFYINELEK